MAAGMDEHHIPGAVVVVVENGQVAFAKGYGYADLENQIPVDVDHTLFRPGSISKLFVFTAVMQLVEQGKLDLDADVNTYLDFEIPATFPEPVTLKHLMSHTPGFEDRGIGLFGVNPEQMMPLGDFLKQNLPARIFAPGKLGAYSNYGAALAGYIVERVSGLSFDEYAEQKILLPLGMTQTTFRQPLPPELAAQMSGGYNYANGEYIQGGFEYVVGYPAGSLSAPGREMANFMIAHLQNGRFGDLQILQEATAVQMHSQLFTHDPRLTGMAYGFFEDIINEQRVISHGGDTLLFHSGLYLLPEQAVGLYVSTNGLDGEPLVKDLIQVFIDRYYPVEAPAPVAGVDFSAQPPAYTGAYYEARSSYTTFEKFFRLFNPISASQEGDAILYSGPGTTARYVETEPGLLVNLENPDERMVWKEIGGQFYLLPSIPFARIKTPWYAAGRLHALILAGGALFYFLLLVFWSLSGLRNLLQRRRAPGAQPVMEIPFTQKLARWLAAGFGLVYLLFLLLFAAVMTDVNPAFGVPNLILALPRWFLPLMELPVLLSVLVASMLTLAVWVWLRRSWTPASRVAFSLQSLCALAITGSLAYWNLIM
jgi:CubicO group peptidase (beta-lactamase class C family)